MQFIEDSFANKVRKNKIKSPLRHDFSIDKWNSAPKITDFDQSLYEAGLYFYSQFKCLRDHLEQLNKIPTSLSKEDYLKFFIGISNRNAKVAIDSVEEILNESQPFKLDINLHAIQTSNNPLGNLLTFNDVSTLIVDGIFYNVLTHLDEKPQNEGPKIRQEDLFQIINTENLLSQLYNSYEQYWNSILYEQISFKINDNQVYLEDNPEIMISSIINEARNTKIRSNQIMINYQYHEDLYKDYLYLVYINNQISYNVFSNLEQKHQQSIISSLFSFYGEETINFLPNTLPDLNYNIDEVIAVFIQLSSLSYDIIRTLNSDTSVEPQNCNKIKSFNKIINTEELTRNLVTVLGIDESKVEQILDFLTFTNKRVPGPRTDLWRSPIIKINDKENLLVLEPLLHPVGLRCFEGWMAKAEVDISQKGTPFENHIKDELKKLFGKNTYIETSKIFERETLSIDGQEEEIDLLFKIGNLVVLGEAKCVVTTDSAISIWNTLEIIKHASEQATRKLDFVSRNFKTICSRFNWTYDENVELMFQPVVLISNGFGIGTNFFGVPILDHNILFSYFKNGKIPLISTGEGEDLSYLRTYNSPEELQKNFSKFSSKPPVFETYRICLNTLTPVKLISCKDGYKDLIQHTPLGISGINESEILAHDYGFELIKLESLDAYLARE
ncbi:hypothetical protein Q4368_10825 [Acinetobacter baumannii]